MLGGILNSFEYVGPIKSLRGHKAKVEYDTCPLAQFYTAPDQYLYLCHDWYIFDLKDFAIYPHMQEVIEASPKV